MSVSPNFDLLTMKQKRVYTVIESYIKTNGIPPTVREIGELAGEKTPGAVQGILNRLEQRGMIKRQVGMARSIQIVAEDGILYLSPVYIPEIKKISDRNVDDFLGIYNIKKYHPMSPGLLKGHQNCFLMECYDNSLTDSGFVEGDLLIAVPDVKPADGDIVLVLYDNCIFLRYYNRNTQPETAVPSTSAEAAGPDCPPDKVYLTAGTNLIGKECFDEDEIKIVGKVIGKYTKY